jgi:hypothetical protein
MHRHGDLSKSTGIELGKSSDDGALIDNCAGDKVNPACAGKDGKAADGRGSFLGISPPLQSHFCNDRAADIADPNCNRPDAPKTMSK